MTTSLMILQGVVSVLLIVLVLVQFGKGAEAGLMSTADSVFTGSQKGNILSKITIVLSILFLGNSVLLAKIQSSRSSKSILDSEAPIARPFSTSTPAATATQNAAPTAVPATAPAADAKKAEPAKPAAVPATKK